MPVEFFERKGIVSLQYDHDYDHTFILSLYDYYGIDPYIDSLVNEVIKKSPDLAKIEKSLVTNIIDTSTNEIISMTSSCLVKNSYGGIGNLVVEYHYRNQIYGKDNITIVSVSNDMETAWDIHNEIQTSFLFTNKFEKKDLFTEVLISPEKSYEIIKSGKIGSAIKAHKNYVKEYFENQKSQMN